MKRTCGAVVLALLFLVLASAGWAGGSTEGSAAKSEAKLVWIYPGPYPQPDQDLVFAKANEIIKQKINATVEFRVMDWSTFGTKMPAMIGAGEKFDVCYTAGWINNYTLNANNGAYVALDDLLTKYAPNLYKSIPAGAWEASRVNGKIYAIPMQQIWAYWDCVFFPASLVEKYRWDLSKIKKPADVEPILKDIKNGEPNTWPTNPRGIISFADHFNGLDYTGAPSVVVSYRDSKATVLNWYEVPGVVEYMKLVRSWFTKGYIRPDILTWKSASAAAETKAKLYGSGWHNTGKPGNEEEMKASSGYDWKMVRFGEPVMTTTNIIATMQAISVTSAHPDRTLELMELMYTDKDLYNIIGFGIDGKHFKKTAANRVERIPDSGYNPNTLWLQGTTFNAYLIGNQPDTLWEETKKLNASAYPSVLLGFNLNLDPIKTLVANVQDAPAQWADALQYGAVDFDSSYQAVLAALKKAGIEDLKAAVQQQINTWMQKKAK